jgi:flagellar hook assembly protein FlgD
LQRALSTVVLLGLLVACAAAFAITEHLKLIKSPIYDTRVTKVFSPVCGCATDQAEIGFTLRRADSLTVAIVDAAGKTVDTLATAQAERRGAVAFHWDGRTRAGTVARNATYQPQIHLANGRTIVMPNRIVVDTVAPKVVSASDGSGLLIAGGHHSLSIQYVFSGRAVAAVYLGGSRVVLGRHKLPTGSVKWNGKRDGKQLPAGNYVLDIAAVDQAGNETPAAHRKRVFVRISYIAIVLKSIDLFHPGERFAAGVYTAAHSYTWTFAGKHGTATKKLLHLRAPSKPGHYRLVVSADGHTTSTPVLVDKK